MSFEATADEGAWFRQHSGVAVDDDAPLPADLNDPAALRWRRELLPGHSTPCRCGDLLVLTTYDETRRQLATVALDRDTGDVRWMREVDTDYIEPVHRTGSPAASSAAFNGEHIFAFFGSFGLLCYDLDGELQWSKPMGPFQDEFGAASSPVLVDGKVILNEDHDVNSFLIAVDQATGETCWRTPREGFTRSYSTPVVWDVDGRPQIVVAGALKLTGYDVQSGEVLWWVDGLSRIVDSTPVIAGDMLYVATWTPGGDQSERIAMEPFSEAVATYDRDNDGKIAKEELSEGPVLQRFFRIDLNQDGALDADEWAAHARVFAQAQNVAIGVRAGARGDATASHVAWIQRKGLPTVPSPLVYRDVMYMVKDGGIVTSLDAGTGEIFKQGRAVGGGNFYASPVAGDGKVYLAGEHGFVTVLKAGPEWEVISSRDFGERIMATPVLDGSRMYVRTDAALYCFEGE
jgi:outer membrane protein assembly factor BamB